jgi:hypothetical protein
MLLDDNPDEMLNILTDGDASDTVQISLSVNKS